MTDQKNNKETRLAEVRSDSTEDGKMVLEGYAIVFGQETLIGDEENGFYESIDAGSLEGAEMKDVPLKYNHDDSHLILARTRNHSLELSVDEKGLKVRAELIDTQSNRDVFASVKSGLLDKMSFAFSVSKQEWDRSGRTPKRKVTGIGRLYDVSVVDLPAYDGTSIYARSLEMADADFRAMDMEEDKRKAEVIRRRIRIKSVI